MHIVVESPTKIRRVRRCGHTCFTINAFTFLFLTSHAVFFHTTRNVKSPDALPIECPVMDLIGQWLEDLISFISSCVSSCLIGMVWSVAEESKTVDVFTLLEPFSVLSSYLLSLSCIWIKWVHSHHLMIHCLLSLRKNVGMLLLYPWCVPLHVPWWKV